jgi:hypothetical protein
MNLYYIIVYKSIILKKQEENIWKTKKWAVKNKMCNLYEKNFCLTSSILNCELKYNMYALFSLN